MSKKILQFIVIFLAILIIICFAFLIYGMYLKIGGNQNISDYKNHDYSLGLVDNEKIIGIEVFNDNSLLFVIKNPNDIYGILYNVKENNIISIIKR